MNEIFVGCDHGGLPLKNRILERLDALGIPYKDCGCYSADSVRYPTFGQPVAQAVSKGQAERGILICSTGIGMSIMANRFRGVRASLCTSALMGRMTRAHNDSNILVLGGKITGEWEAMEILDAWLNTPFEGGRHQVSLDMIDETPGC